LYFRLNVFQIRMPALRERVDDIELLARAFLQRIDPHAPPLPAETLDYLRQQRWGGNVRELHHALEHAAILARGTPLRPEHFPTPTTVPGSLPLDRLREAVRVWVAEQIGAAGTNEPAGLYDALLQAVEPVLLEEVLNRVDGNRVTTARWLGLARATLRKLMLRYQLVAAADEPDSP
jgi:two-component system nitrogen regulation response regulator GlnG